MIFQKEVGEALTLKFAQTAAEMKAQGREIISLGLGEPDFKTPEYIVQAAFDAINKGYTHYSAVQGLQELRELIANDLNNSYGSDYSPAEVIITPGIKAAAYFSLAAILQPQDEVILISPYYVSYPAMIKLAEPDSKIIRVPLEKNFTLDIEKIKAAFSDRTKAIVINFPNNPTGMFINDAEMSEIANLAIKHNAYIISDEVYSKLIYGGGKCASLAQHKDAKDYAIICNGYSKSHAMTGWRLGYAVAPSSVIKKMNKLQQHINTNTCTFVQKSACAIYSHEAVHLKAYLEELEKRMSYFCSSVNSFGKMSAVCPKAGFFCFADISSYGQDSNTFCSLLLKKTGIASTPGIAFGPEWDSYVRFSLAVPMSTVERAVKLLKDY